MDQLLINLKLDRWTNADLSYLYDYCLAVSRSTNTPIPPNYPAVGRDAFRTSTGVHAAAIVKAMKRNEPWLVDAVYSGVPASMVGRQQEIEIGFMSGASNVAFYLRQRGLEPTDELVARILERAKAKREILNEDEILGLCQA
jgi:2-isopropylmalate synthase